MVTNRRAFLTGLVSAFFVAPTALKLLPKSKTETLISDIQTHVEKLSEQSIFEVNDTTLRNNFKINVSNHLQKLKNSRQIYDFNVICDETNNTTEIIMNKEFTADIYIKPNKTISYINMKIMSPLSEFRELKFEDII